MESIRDAIGYPIRGGAWALLLGGAVLSLIVEFMVNHVLLLLGLAVLVLGVGYFAAYLFAIVGSTMNGRDEAPDWPSFSSFTDDMLVPFFRFFAILLFAFGPLFAVQALRIPLQPGLGFVYWLALAYGCLYFPMAVVAACAFGSVTGALPYVVIPAVVRVLPRYLLPVSALVLAYEVLGAAGAMASAIPFFGAVLAAVVGLYALMVEARLVGLLYRDEEERLSWDTP